MNVFDFQFRRDAPRVRVYISSLFPKRITRQSIGDSSSPETLFWLTLARQLCRQNFVSGWMDKKSSREYQNFGINLI